MAVSMRLYFGDSEAVDFTTLDLSDMRASSQAILRGLGWMAGDIVSHTHTHTHAHKHPHTPPTNTHAHTQTHAHTHTRTHTYTHTQRVRRNSGAEEPFRLLLLGRLLPACCRFRGSLHCVHCKITSKSTNIYFSLAGKI